MKKRMWIISILTVIAGLIVTSVALLSDNEPDKAEAATESSSLQTSNEIVAMDWCAEHSVPESQCSLCNPSLIEKFKASGDWCVGHDLPESHCRLCNPEITFPQEKSLSFAEAKSFEKDSFGLGQTKNELDWCAEHSVPESECALCNPSLIEKFKASGDWCVGHDLPESHCRLCHPDFEFPQ